MSSKKLSDLLDLQRDLPTTAADVLALKKNRNFAGMDFESYLRFLETFPSPNLSALCTKKGPKGIPFEL